MLHAGRVNYVAGSELQVARPVGEARLGAKLRARVALGYELPRIAIDD